MTVGSKRRTCRGKEHEIEDAAIDATGAEPPVRDPEELEAAGAPATAEISPLTSLGSVHLTVSDLGRSVEYYEAAVGLELLDRSAGRASLGVGARELLVLIELPGARPASGYTGLYHFALLVPHRIDLASWLAHAARDWEGQVAERMTTVPLDVDSLVAELPDPESATFDGLAGGTIIGHIHLKVAAIPETVAFYGDVLGFGLMATLGPYATFLSAGGYHHHIGANTWESAGAPAPPEGTAALRHATIVLPDEAARDRVLGRVEASGQSPHPSSHGPLVFDPAGNALVLAMSSS